MTVRAAKGKSSFVALYHMLSQRLMLYIDAVQYMMYFEGEEIEVSSQNHRVCDRNGWISGRRPGSKEKPMKWKDRVSGLAALGVFGGMGPLASAEFVRTIYRLHHGEEEQKSPIVFLYSDPQIPDRTTCFLKGDDNHLAPQLTHGLQLLAQLGMPVIVICCFTMHHLLPRIPMNLRRRVVSLIDVLAEEILESGGTYLMACTTGTRRLGLLERHVNWPQVRGHIVYPNDSDQARLHDAIYFVKRGHSTEALHQLLLRFAATYKVDGLVAGCTELHLLARDLVVPPVKLGDFPLLDPLTHIAVEIAKVSPRG